MNLCQQGRDSPALHLYGIVDYLFGEESVVDIVKSYNYRKDEENNLEITCLHFLRKLSDLSPAHTEPEANWTVRF